MNSMFRIFAVTALASLVGAGVASSHEIKAGDLVITKLWTRATPGGAKVAGGYLTITNNGQAADRLVSAASPVSGKAELHEMSMKDGVMNMRPLDAGLAIEPGKSVTLAPGGLHLMLMDLKEPVKEGSQVPVTLRFEKAGSVETFLHAQGVGAKGMSDAPMNEHKH